MNRVGRVIGGGLRFATAGLAMAGAVGYYQLTQTLPGAASQGNLSKTRNHIEKILSSGKSLDGDNTTGGLIYKKLFERNSFFNENAMTLAIRSGNTDPLFDKQVKRL